MRRKKARPLSKKAGMSLANIPVPEFLTKNQKVKRKKKNRQKDKHGDAFVAYAKWFATPSDKRDPPTKKEFMKIWKLPPHYVYNWEDDEEFLHMVDRHYWRWLYGLLPDITQAAFERAVSRTRGSSQDAKLLMELIGKRMQINKPATRIQPFFLIGVDQNKIEDLFTPKKYIEAAEVTLERERKRRGYTSFDEVPADLKVEAA